MKAKKLTQLEEDNLGFFIVGLVRLGWSFRKIEKAIGRHIDVVNRLYSNALDKIENGESYDLIDMRNKNNRFKMITVGGTQDLEFIENAIIERQSGRRAIGHKAEY